ncbi:MAG: hypothetical protein KGJ23_05360 [Euryarchaeota archaeon]|nr:hypothetical protein [Euryarchaeota archaeon]MDE1836025.1 hypothetical protein [Euryarchaeota archaeon]MDE1881881.1 hypothetical protein [Euryarchaeota archaeon]MDE2046389.1 hypothetical protein [Thermoplasmata archaeon]
MSDLGTGESRRYCSVCGYLSSEPMSGCPRCSMSTTHVPQVAPTPVLFAPEWSPTVRAGRGPPAWIVIGLLLALVILVIVVTLAVDGVFSPTPGSLLASVVPPGAVPSLA